MVSKHSRQRSTAFSKQNGLCCYFNSPMWQKSKKKFSKDHSISSKEAANFQCTAEHLLARCDGGNDNDENIVAARSYCNSLRHQRTRPKPALDYKAYIQQGISKEKWDPRSQQHMIVR